MKLIMTLLVTLLFLTDSNFSKASEVDENGSYDYVECRRDTVETRQFCSLRDEILTVRQDINLKATANGIDFDLKPFFRIKGMEIETIGSDGIPETQIIPLYGLNPFLGITLNWASQIQCRKSALWKDTRVSIHSVDYANENRNIRLDEVRFGSWSYEYNLGEINSEVHQAFRLFVSNSNVQYNLSSKIRLVDREQSPTAPPAISRIPRYCSLGVQSAQLFYKDEYLRSSAEVIRAYYHHAKYVLAKAPVLHNYLVNGQLGALCSIHKLASALKEAELIFSNYEEDLEMLSPSSKGAISEAVHKAVDIGAIDPQDIPPDIINPDALDFWRYYLDNRTTFFDSCKELQTSQEQETSSVSIDPFVGTDGTILDYDGYNNANDYLREKRNLIEIVGALLAIIEAGQYGDELNDSFDWLFDADNYLSIGN